MSYLLYLICIVSVVVFDQITKMIAIKQLLPISTYPIIKDVIHFTYVENRGAAFGILKDQRWIFMILSTVVVVVILYIMVRYKKYLHPIMLIGLSFTVGGGIGNMIDRTVKGYVVDFIDFTLIDFAVFNIADTFICIGVGLIILDIIIGKSDYSFLESNKMNSKTENGTEDETDSH